MKLMVFIIMLFTWSFNVALIIIMLPYTLWIYSKNQRWRKKPQVGDVCYFKSRLGIRTYGTIEYVDRFKDQVKFVTEDFTQWRSIGGLRKY